MGTTKTISRTPRAGRHVYTTQCRGAGPSHVNSDHGSTVIHVYKNFHLRTYSETLERIQTPARSAALLQTRLRPPALVHY